jgi:1,4-dihydroxy-2-naphthoate octaprenyltransferase
VASLSAWKTAARVHTLPAAIVPVLVGAGLATGDDVFRLDVLAWTLLGAISIQVAANFANDASDAQRGADSEDRLGPPRMVALGVITARQMWIAVTVAVALASVSAIALTAIAGPVVLVLGVASVLGMLGYVGGPLPYGYHGLGEVGVFVFFGLVATVGSRYVYDGTAPLDAWLLAVPIGSLAAAILVANNYRDIDTDRAAGKRTLSVIIGRARTRTLFAVLLYGSYLLIVAFAAIGWTPLPTMVAGLLAPFAVGPVSIVQKKTDGPNLIRALKSTARLHLWTGVVLAVGSAIVI